MTTAATETAKKRMPFDSDLNESLHVIPRKTSRRDERDSDVLAKPTINEYRAVVHREDVAADPTR